ncbi:PhnD/SsuA/transferrin family substrate-binding protein [Roseinatronobacter sp. S2]|uniref:PhnD/SsuA/transferrin family substrate-binding protein n=1 Tax=Roseinatronobacter sp. S2 TaxID=3035471 RepID=UPI00240F5E24|nr:PhnD/SsuA/transferrin family substrate-binding protein [Roseinatronobacter sp. S2]WFE75316.1 PhnD/SsuA/transferrin family substrate-binding protein [Roseinatronobacter sp. S2]
MMRLQRRKVLVAAGLALLSAPMVLRAQPVPFRFGLTPVFLDNDWQLLDFLRAHLSTKMGGEVEFLQRRTYKEVTALLLMGEIDAAWLCGYPLLQNSERLSALALPVWQGQPNYSAKIITSKGRTAQYLEDLRGDIHAYSDPDSNSGHLVTVSELLKQNHRPEAFFARSFFTYGHRNVVRAVARGLAQSGSVDGYVYEAMQRAEPELVARTHVLWESEQFGFPPIVVAREALDSGPAQSFFTALTTMQESDAGQAALQMLQLDGFAAPDAHSFDQIAARMRIVAERG